MPIKLSSHTSFGSTIHNTLNIFYKRIHSLSHSKGLFSEYDEDISLDALLSIYKESWIFVGYDSKTDEDRERKEGEKMLIKFYELHKDNFGDPLFLEKSFKLHIGDSIISGRIDRIDQIIYSENKKTIEIIDYKTGKIRGQKEVDDDLQLSIYAMACENCLHLNVEKLSFYFVGDNKKIETKRSKEDIEKAKEEIIGIMKKIRDKEFIADPSKQKCKCCSYKNICTWADI